VSKGFFAKIQYPRYIPLTKTSVATDNKT